MNIINAIEQRHACRAFLDKPVSTTTVAEILRISRWAPSGVNSQPWQVAVVSGEHKAALTAAMITAREQQQTPQPDYQYYPGKWQEPYRRRRVECGKALYQALGVNKGDKDAQQRAWNNNYHSFGAPLVLYLFVDKHMETGSWIDMGIFVQTVMLAAQAYGLASCPQASLADYPDIVRTHLQISEELAVVCGVALGYADIQHPVNQYRLPRADLEEFVRWYD